MTTGTLLRFAGSAAPPAGWCNLVAREPRYLRRGLTARPCFLRERDFHWVLAEQGELMRQFFFRPDTEERWERPKWETIRLATGWWTDRLAGDCDDFALELRARLERRVKPGALRLVQCWTERGEGHLALAVDTFNRGTLIADNRRPLSHWSALDYRFLGGVTEVPGRARWAWNIHAPTLAELLRRSTT